MLAALSVHASSRYTPYSAPSRLAAYFPLPSVASAMASPALLSTVRSKPWDTVAFA